MDIELENWFKFNTVEGLITSIIELLLIFAGVVALVYLIIGGYSYTTAAGNPEQAAKAKDTILGAVIGLIIIFGSYAIIHFVISNLLVGEG